MISISMKAFKRLLPTLEPHLSEPRNQRALENLMMYLESTLQYTVRATQRIITKFL